MTLTININKRSAIAMACIALVCAVTSASAIDVAKPTVPPINPQSASGVATTTKPQPSASAAAPAPTAPIETGLKAKPLNSSAKAPQGLAAGEGRVLYAYGQSQPTVTCAPLHVCVVSLMPGEQINDLSIGDSVRWLVQTSKAGDSPVVILKPTEAGIGTNLVVSTNRQRVYYLILESSATKYQPQVGFYDAADMTTHFEHHEEEELSKQLAPGKIDPSSLDFGFSCDSSGGDDFKPTRVFSGDGHLYLQMPPNIKSGDLPALFNVSSSNTEMINSRFDPLKGYLVADGIPSKVKLVVGDKDGNRSVTCSRTK
ncbi:TrbG/VirB9 family P-type conjugative transfer protein [Polynucleobacter sp. Fuers-14]|uniref:TrbG/VirB9 family P-type conjugative transfer protein n=1 Tax=Polynucleobacter sp. Fuers-14 TaxID=1758364 RepID=UPI001C0D0B6B|nr:TrbG/VirB9 family P-type conjugative transfer protein [Polynucleobacter sp. Fuers-14]MBU3641012.1 TrbG/VirB9 family P-type conjugative transfer protein [Polynucleobacter sp. Fuers-14]